MKKIKKKIICGALTFACACFAATGISAVKKDLPTFAVRAQGTEELAPAQLFVDVNDCTIEGDCEFPVDYSVSGNGVKITTSVSGAKVKFVNPINLAALKKEDNLIEFQVLSKGYGAVFEAMYLTLTDVHDSSNSLQIRVKQHPWRNDFGTIAVNYDGRWMYYHNLDPSNPWYGKIVDDVNESVYGTVIETCFDASKPVDGNYKKNMPAAIVNFDYENNRVYTGGQLVMDMADGAQIGYGREWKKFTTGECYAEISFENMTGKGGVVISEFAGQKLGGDKVVDNTPPSVLLDASLAEGGKLPDARMYSLYNLPEVTALDVVEGYVDLTMQVKLGATDVTDLTLVEPDKLLFRQEGEYVLIFAAKDGKDNGAERRLTVNARRNIGQIRIDFLSPPETAYVNSVYEIPEFAYTGGSGRVEFTYDVYYNYRKIELPENRKIRLDEVGSVKIVVKAKDYIGSQTASADYFEIPVVAPDHPVIVVKGVPTAAVTGKNLILPEAYAIDYSKNQERRKVQVSVGGKDVSDTLTYKVTEKGGQTLSVKYRVDDYEEEYPVQVIEPSHIGNYILTDKTVALDEESETRYTQYGFTGSNVFRSAMPLSAEYLEINVLPVKNARRIDFRFRGYYENEEIFFRVERDVADRNKCTVQINGEGVKYPLDGTLDSENNPINFLLAAREGKLLKPTGAAIADIPYAADGLEFEGFAGGAVRMEIEFFAENESEESAMRFYKIANQMMIMPVFGKFQDRFAPVLYCDEEMASRNIGRGESFLVSSARAYDFLDSDVTTSVSVTAPDGKVLLDRASADVARFFVGEEYGIYTVVYYYADTAAADDPYTSEYYISVVDSEPPKIIVTGKIPPERARAGEKFTVPAYSVKDNLSAACESRVFMQYAGNAYYEDITGVEKYTFTGVGKYTLIIYAYDEAYNISSFRFTIEVSR